MGLNPIRVLTDSDIEIMDWSLLDTFVRTGLVGECVRTGLVGECVRTGLVCDCVRTGV